MERVPTAVVTGANRGIGREIARQLALKGFRVFVGARRREAGEGVLVEFAKAGLKAEVVELDVTDSATISRAAASISSECSSLDVLVNNAAILEDEGQEILKLTPQTLLTTLETNTFGPFRVTQAFWPLLGKAKPDRIINVSSEAGSLSSMESYAPAYSISKAGLNALTSQFAAAGRSEGIVVESMCPGWLSAIHEIGKPIALAAPDLVGVRPGKRFWLRSSRLV